MTRTLAGLLVSLAVATSAGAIPAAPALRTFAQPDGTTLAGFVRGDEHVHWLATAAGHPIARGRDGYLYYVSRYAGEQAVLSSERAELPRSSSLPRIAPPLARVADAAFDLDTLRGGTTSPKVLFVLVDYADQPAKFTNPKLWEGKLYDPDAPSSASVVDYYLEASQGAAELTPAEETHKKKDNGIVGWLRLAGNHPNPGQYRAPGAAGPAGTADETAALNDVYVAAIGAADPFVDYGDFDENGDAVVEASELAIVVVVSGYDQAASDPSATPSLWPRKLLGSLATKDGVVLLGEYVIMAEIQQDGGKDHSTTLGTPVHELGHLIFGLPDLYDVDYSSDGIGPYGVMGTGCYGWNPAVDEHLGETPVLPDAWSLYRLGWAETDGVLAVTLHSTGKPLAGGAIDPRLAIAACDDGPEYFLAQYRTYDGYDAGLDGFIDFSSGVLIFHVDESVADNTDDARRLVDVEEANAVDLSAFSAQEGNLWVEGVADAFDAASTPSSDYNDGSPSDVSITVGAESTFGGFDSLAKIGSRQPVLGPVVAITVRCQALLPPPPLAP